ncbi:MAG: S8 family serine peptidase [Lachnospiraceae bacterium]|nr:S8 family serine peptidase [Lachnospiraceae bacterium]
MRSKISLSFFYGAFAVLFTAMLSSVPSYAETGTGHDQFSKQLSALVMNNPPDIHATVEDSSTEFSSSRLIVKPVDADMSFSSFSPTNVLRSDDGICILQFYNPFEAKKAYDSLKTRNDVEWVESDVIIDSVGNSAKEKQLPASYGSLSWGVNEMEIDKYAASTSRSGITVAVIDTGVASHSFLTGRLVTGYDFVNNDTDPTDEHYHGTHVAGTIVDCTPGLNVKIMPVRVLSADGSGYSSVIASGIRYAADHGASIINMSLGGGHSDYIDTYVKYAVNKGVTVVCAAGNNSSSTSYFCPAHISEAIVVAAIDSSENRASFSNYGNSVDVAAPGVSITSCIPGGGYSALNGTSMASPHVAAAAAMIKLNNPSATPAAIESALKNCCKDLGTGGYDIYYGYGVPKLSKLLTTPITPEPEPVIPDPEPVNPTPDPVIPDPEPVNPTPDPVIPDPEPVNPAPDPVIPDPDPVIPDPWTPDPDPVIPEPDPIIPDPVPDTTGFEYIVDYSGAVITGYTGAGGDISIPSSLGGYGVSLIAANAFNGNSNIRSLSISNIVIIGENAFANCSVLEAVSVSGIVNGIGSGAFAGCKSLKSISVNGMVFGTVSDAFSGCDSLADAYISGMIDTSVKDALTTCGASIHNSGLYATTTWPFNYPDLYYAR